ncbi:4-hydroxybenzoate octaprenyltransferase [candidate division BRC1 bacterium HGW-BRC1-1]|jgi:4-hydroxybenzoate polyprenyltransferase|nr:MAG: 4-hydroxybenzoate octaprenyltransferase [candidate division BRC1 bacterium HGW-BRC1-1]
MLEMIKFQHTIFALPFALTGAILAAQGMPSLQTLALIVAASVCARTAAMSFNRWADAALDARNPRTSNRAIPAGELRRPFVLAVALGSAVLFVGCAAMLNRLAFWLSPVALVVLLGYSYTKHFTSLAHFVLGMALGIAPVGAWIAVRGDITATPVLLGLGVMVWTAGFDLIYACQDYEFDVREGLYSIPARIGIARALLLSRVLHILAVATFIGAGLAFGAGTLYFIGVGAVAILLVTEHLIVNPRDLSRINVAFFTVNSWVGMVIFAATAADLWMKSR